MSIKKLFDSATKNKNYSDYANKKEKFEFVESAENAKQLNIKNQTFVPQIDYSKPQNFVKYSSAYLFYKGALSKIIDYYPYDGSEAEKTKFYNELMEGEKYIYDNLYPTSTGYALLSADGWGSKSSTSDGYGLPASLEYITFKGGPLTSSGDTLVQSGPDPTKGFSQHANIYDENIYQTAGLPNSYGKGSRLSNLRSNFNDGVSVEFWLKKAAFNTTLTQREVLLDVWNNQVSSSVDYGRITIELDGGVGSSATPFKITVQSGTTPSGIYKATIGASDVTKTSLTSWTHYAFTFHNTGSNFYAKMYKNGVLNDSNKYTSTTINELNSKGMMGRIGALLTAPSGNYSASAGAGKLSASMDDFRFWKVLRNSQELNRNWFTNVHGGANTDISNTTLGIYYKFNEGITSTASLDSVVLDYAGRISNGVWTGYDSHARNTGSAIADANAAIFENEDPIIRSNHPRYLNLSSSLLATGSFYDQNNNTSFISYMPAWVIEDHEKIDNQNLKLMSHIVGTYFDKLYLLSREIPRIRQTSYMTSSTSPVPFARHLPQSLGLYMPETFIDSTIVEKLLNRSETAMYEGILEDTKNQIYINLYNNLTNIFKSKGTERSIKNVLRCFNLDDSLIQLKNYSTSTTYELADNLVQKNVAKNFIDFNTKNAAAVIYQAYDSTNTDSRGYVSGSTGSADVGWEDAHGMTVEASVMFPRYISGDPAFMTSRGLITSASLFGVHMPAIAGPPTGTAATLLGTDTTYASEDWCNFQVYAVRDKPNSKNVYFQLTSSNSPHPIPTLSSSIFFNVYDDNLWNFSVRVKPSTFPLSNLVSGAIYYNYQVEFSGINTMLGRTQSSFTVSGTMAASVGINLLRAHKRLYGGARRTNITGAILNKSDVKLGGMKYWTKYIDDDTLEIHANNPFNQGLSGSHFGISALQLSGSTLDMLNHNTLALNWSFEAVTASNSDGNFVTTDFSSGSSLLRRGYGYLGNTTGYQHSGYGYGFSTSSANVLDKKLTNIFEFVDPEQAVSSEMVNIKSDDEEVFEQYQTLPNYLFTLEKSFYSNVSSEMLNFFAGAIDFNNLIGHPVNRYRERYKDLEKLREVFFRRVTKITEVEKFVNYYKWFDDAISVIVGQLVPASADYIEDVMNVVEPHVLERNKYQTKFPTLEFKLPEIDGFVRGINEKTYRWDIGHSPSGSDTANRDVKTNTVYWSDRAERTANDISSGDSTVDAQRETIRKITITDPFFTSSIKKLRTIDGTTYNEPIEYRRRKFQKLYQYKVTNPINSGSSVKGGVNFEPSKNIHFTYNALHPAGPVNTEDGKFIPENVLFSMMSDLVKVRRNKDSAHTKESVQNSTASQLPRIDYRKNKRHVPVIVARDFDGGLNYSNVKSSLAFPFNIFDSNVKSGYQKNVSSRLSGNVTITNIHNDVYGPNMEKPMQGPFTEFAVGGHQSRHIRLNFSGAHSASGAGHGHLDSWESRPEAWKLLLGTCTDTLAEWENSGAIGMVGADYPYPEANRVGEVPYPMTASQKAVYYRDFVAKRPVNIKNIQHRSGSSTRLGNYNHNYDVVSTFGAYSNPRAFVDNPPVLPKQLRVHNTATGSSMSSSTNVRTIFDITRTMQTHSAFVDEYSTGYFTASTKNKSVIRTRFRAYPSIENSSYGYLDIRSGEFSPYNAISYRNLRLIKPSQGPSGTIAETWKAGGPHETTGSTAAIRVFDIHGKDFGLRSHLARHSAKFGRDSLHVTGTKAYDPPDNEVILSGGVAFGPGAIYRQLPSFHKINRNSRRRIKDQSSLVAEWRIKPLSNTRALNYPIAGGGDGTGATLYLTGTAAVMTSGRELVAAVTSSGLTFSGWVYFDASANTRRLLHIGQTSTNETYFALEKYKVDSSYRFRVSLATTDGSSITEPKWYITSISPNTFQHIAVAWTGSNGTVSSSHAVPNIWLNGVSQSVFIDSTAVKQSYPSTFKAEAAFKNHTGDVSFNGYNFVTFGGSMALTSVSFSGSLDEVSMWKRPLNQAEVTEIYNGGNPCDITGSYTYLSNSSDLWEWIRMGDGEKGTNAISSSNPGSLSTSNQITGEINSLTFLPVAKRTENTTLEFNTADNPPLRQGCNGVRVGLSESVSFLTSAQHDNFYVSHSIPKTSLRYAWITSSYVRLNDMNPGGYVKADFRVSRSSGIHNAIDFVSSSDFGSTKSSLGRIFNRDRRYPIMNEATYLSFLPTDFVGLNLNIVDPISTASLTKGNSTDLGIEKYINIDLCPLGSDAEGSASILNSILLNRNGPYGYQSFQALRQYDRKMLRKFRQNNLAYFVSSTGSHDDIATFEMPPVSLRGRTLSINMDDIQEDGSRNNNTYKANFSNEYLYFNTPLFDNQFDINLDSTTTAGEQLLAIGLDPDRAFETNWVKYTENIFPSKQNEFLSRSVNKIGYDNKYWRNNRGSRATLGNTLKNSQYISVSQSCWILDAPQDFLTRTTASFPTVTYLWLAGNKITGSDQIITSSMSLRESGSAGELQNTYSSYFTASNGQGGTMNNLIRGGILTPAALYARKQMITTPHSVVSPSGMLIPQTDSVGGGGWPGPWDSAYQQEPFAGEAVWQASSQAGLLDAASVFQLSSSRPWFNSYDDYNYLIGKVSTAQGQSIVPEYRISEHIEDYVNNGAFNENKFNTFEVPETTANSSTSSFYTDYSNSEFLGDFLNIKSLSGLNAKQIKLVCSGTIRFNPYKGFYPAQRTLDLVRQFYRTYSGDYGDWGNQYYLEPNTDRDTTTAPGISGSMLKGLYQALFAPGILYNSIKSGMAVDWPIVTNFNKVSSDWWGTAAGDQYGHNWALTIKTGSKISTFPKTGSPTTVKTPNLGAGESIWDKRLDFESLIYPETHLNGITFGDMDSHPSASVLDKPIGAAQTINSRVTYTFDRTGNESYSLMAKNFFGAVADFYLKDSDFTSLKSKGVRNNKTFSAGDVFMGRIKLRRTMEGDRSYKYESGSYNAHMGIADMINQAYTKDGARAVRVTGSLYSDTTTSEGNGVPFRYALDETGYPIPQDPINTHLNDAGPYRENFTLYSRPTAFGPPIAGLNPLNSESGSIYHTNNVMDSFTGYNGAYTPPYYNGESWCDIIFRPQANQSYNLERILNESKFVYWRVDAGFPSGSTIVGSDALHEGAPPSGNVGTTLVYDDVNLMTNFGITRRNDEPGGLPRAIYAGSVINGNSMQMSASIDLFGIEEITLLETDPTTKKTSARNDSVGQRWVIKPKFETPHMNFASSSLNRTNDVFDVSMPVYGSGSVPRGMWHQFGTLDKEKGVYLEYTDIPENWLQNHHLVKWFHSAYNNNTLENSETLYSRVKSFTEICDFDTKSVRLGELKESIDVYEAVVAVPYIISYIDPDTTTTRTEFSEQITRQKSFVSIPEERYNAALTNVIGTKYGDSEEAAGESIRRQVELMKKYIFPPELDFVSNQFNMEPIVMYIFEFKYSFDKDDLSYMWQNLAPRNHQKITTQATYTAHELIDTELLTEENLSENENLRWMVFKVKQRSQADWTRLKTNSDPTTLQDILGAASPRTAARGPGVKTVTPPFLENGGFRVAYNWPYDYLSFVEKIKIDAEILFKEEEGEIEGREVSGLLLTPDQIRVSDEFVGTVPGPQAAPAARTILDVRKDTGKLSKMDGTSDSNGLDTMDIPDSDNTGNY